MSDPPTVLSSLWGKDKCQTKIRTLVLNVYLLNHIIIFGLKICFAQWIEQAWLNGCSLYLKFISLHIRSMWETTVMHKQVSGWTVNFGPNFPEYPFLELKTRIPPPPISETSDLGWPKFTPEYPPHFGKLQIWDDQSLLRNTPPNENCQRVQVRDFQNTESYYMWRLYPTRITTSYTIR